MYNFLKYLAHIIVVGRYEKLVEQEEVNFQQQRRKLYTELAQEKQKMADEVQRQRELFEVRLTEVKEKHIR